MRADQCHPARLLARQARESANDERNGGECSAAPTDPAHCTVAIAPFEAYALKTPASIPGEPDTVKRLVWNPAT
jgi:hypothetical protein